MTGLTQQIKKASSIFPDLPRHSPVVDKDGNFTPIWHFGVSSLFQTLQRNFTNEGFFIPTLPESQLDEIESLYAPFIGKSLVNIQNISGKMVYDTTNSVPKIFVIIFTDPADFSSAVVSASWKTFTIT